MKVLILTYYFPPAGGSGVQRWLKFVKYLPEFDIEPIVYTVENPNYPIIDKSLEKEIPKGIEILRQPILEPNSILSKFGKKNIQSAGFLNKNPSKIGKSLQYIRANYFIPDARKFWIEPSVKFLTKYLENNPIDTIITTGPPHSVHLIGLALKEKTTIKWIADFRDPWTDIDYFHQLPLTKKSIKKHHELEEKVLKNADDVIVVGNTMQNNYLKFNLNTHTITNGFDDFEINQNIHVDNKFSLLHIGMLNADRNHKMLWEVLAEIKQEVPDFNKDLEIKLIGKVCNEALDAIKANSLSANLNIIEYIEHNQVIAHQKSAQVLLLLINNVPSAKGIITGKIFEYLQAQRPILAIAPRNGDLASILQNTNAGIIIDFNDKKALKKAILSLYNDYKNGVLEINSLNIEKYHRKELTKELAKILTT
jgi:glycosyltransferase involved in cell wall biosynthesis